MSAEATRRAFLAGAAGIAGGAAFALPVAAPDAATELVAAVVWRWLRGTGLEYCELGRRAAGWRLAGSTVALVEARPVRVEYEVLCDPAWRTTGTTVVRRDAAGERRIALRAAGGRWWREGREVPELAGCLDVDLGWSPSTNTLPIRRLGLAVSQTSPPLTMAWLRWPDLELLPLAQEYTRLAEREYLYASRGGSFQARVAVDAQGLAIDYEGVWERIASSAP